MNISDLFNAITAVATAGTLVFITFQWVRKMAPTARAFANTYGESDWLMIRLEIAPSNEQVLLESISSNHGCLAKSSGEYNEIGVYIHCRDPLSESDSLALNAVIQPSAFSGETTVIDVFALRNSEIKKPITLCIRYKVLIFRVKNTVIAKMDS